MISIENNPSKDFLSQFSLNFDTLTSLVSDWKSEKEQFLTSFSETTKLELKNLIENFILEAVEEIKNQNDSSLKDARASFSEFIDSKIDAAIENLVSKIDTSINNLEQSKVELFVKIRNEATENINNYIKSVEPQFERFNNLDKEIKNLESGSKLIKKDFNTVSEDLSALRNTISNYINEGVYSRALTEKLAAIETASAYNEDLIKNLLYSKVESLEKRLTELSYEVKSNTIHIGYISNNSNKKAKIQNVGQ